MVTLNMESRNPMGRVNAENRSKTQKPLGFKGLMDTFIAVVIQTMAWTEILILS